ncbi:trichodiene synthase [Xylaria castorea]|nr:trichodiene synthase [Xylaria castorea]
MSIEPAKGQGIPDFTTSRDIIATCVRNLVTNMGFNLRTSPTSRDLELEDKVIDKFTELGLSSTDFESMRYLHQISCLFASLCHKRHPMDLKVYIAVYTILTIGADDLLLDVPEMHTFTHKFGKHEPQGHPHLDCLARHLVVETPKFFGPFGTNIIIASTLDAINGLSLESKFPGGFPRSMPGFSWWMRVEVGYGSAFGYFIFPAAEFPEPEWLGRYVQIIPNLRDIICYVNDVISFYKERFLAKENCLVSNLAREKSCNDLSSLASMCEHALSLNQTIREILGLNEELVLAAYNDYMLGYIEWHFRVGRYKLDELGLTLT